METKNQIFTSVEFETQLSLIEDEIKALQFSDNVLSNSALYGFLSSARLTLELAHGHLRELVTRYEFEQK